MHMSRQPLLIRQVNVNPGVSRYVLFGECRLPLREWYIRLSFPLVSRQSVLIFILLLMPRKPDYRENLYKTDRKYHEFAVAFCID